MHVHSKRLKQPRESTPIKRHSVRCIGSRQCIISSPDSVLYHVLATELRKNVKGSARAQSMDEHGYTYGKACTPPYESKILNAFSYNSLIKFPENPFSGPGVLYAQRQKDRRGDYNRDSVGMRSRLKSLARFQFYKELRLITYHKIYTLSG